MEREEIIQRLEAATTHRDIRAATHAAGEWLTANTRDGEAQDPNVLAAVWSAFGRSNDLPMELPAGASVADRVWAMPRPYAADRIAALIESAV